MRCIILPCSDLKWPHAFTKEKFQFFMDIGAGADLTELTFCAGQSHLGCAAVAFSLPACPTAARRRETELRGHRNHQCVPKSGGALCSGSF